MVLVSKLKKINMKIFKKSSGIIIASGLFALSLPQRAAAQCSETGNTIGQGIECAGGTLPENLSGGGGIITIVINILLAIVGIASVIMIIVGALRMVLSAGNEKTAADARNTVLYAVIGLVVAILAFAIVNFVIGSLSS